MGGSQAPRCLPILVTPQDTPGKPVFYKHRPWAFREHRGEAALEALLDRSPGGVGPQG